MKKLMKDPTNLAIAGVGGQGNLVISSLIGSALVREGYLVTSGETYGASQRGGAVVSHVRISMETRYGPLIPGGRAHVVLGMEPMETIRVLRQFGNRDVITIVNPRPIYPVTVLSGEAEYPDVDKLVEAIKGLSAKTYVINAVDEAQKLGKTILANTILIGALVGTGILPLDRKALEPLLREQFPNAIKINLTALNRGIELGSA